MMGAVILGLGSVVWAGTACAQDHEIATYGPLLEQCYEEADGARAKAECIGATAQACMTEEEGGETTLGMSMCTHAEAEVWDRFLNAEYKALMAASKVMDEDEAAYFPEFANRADKLREAQRAWIAFRDAECALAYAQWGAGSMRHIAGSDCMMRLVAERTIALREMREMFE